MLHIVSLSWIKIWLLILGLYECNPGFKSDETCEGNKGNLIHWRFDLSFIFGGRFKAGILNIVCVQT